MNYFVDRYIQRCKEEFSNIGFQRKKNSFVRVENDVIQFFSLKHLRGVYSCSIEFESAPFCCGKPSLLGTGGTFRIEWFEGVDRNGEWEYDPHDENSVNKCIEDLILSIKKHIIPFFEKTTTPAEVFDETHLIEIGLTKDDREQLTKTNNYSKYRQINIFTDPDRYYISLKTKNYDFAKWYLENIIKIAERAYEETKDILTDSNKKERKAFIIRCKSEIKKLELNEFDYFDEIVESKEREAKEFLYSLKLKNKSYAVE